MSANSPDVGLSQGRVICLLLAAVLLASSDKLRGSKRLYDRGGGLWVGAKNDGLYHVSDGAADHFEVADGLSDDRVSDENSPGLDESLLGRREDGGGL